MGQFLNSREPYDKYRTVMNGTYGRSYTGRSDCAGSRERWRKGNDIPGAYWRLESVMIKKQKNMPVK